jgi:2-polyprenyl-6-methoxyphenol hydroxylase-like FAD-dependent oxidoreductase
LHPEAAPLGDELAAAKQRFSGWPQHVRATIEATEPSQLIRNDIYHLPGGLPSYVRGRVVVIGDAAHAMVPNSGHGAASSLEDGVCVGRLIAAPVAAGGDQRSAMVAFDRARRPRCRQFARQGLLLARMGDGLRGGWRQSVRNALLRLIPAGPAMKAGARTVRWTPPPPNPQPVHS